MLWTHEARPKLAHLVFILKSGQLFSTGGIGPRTETKKNNQKKKASVQPPTLWTGVKVLNRN